MCKKQRLRCFVFPSHKLGVLNTKAKDYKNNLKRYTKYFSNIRKTLSRFRNPSYAAINLEFINYKNVKYTVFNSASIPYLLSCNKKTNISKNAIVTGGRTYNERYKEYTLDFAADVDLKSCLLYRDLIYL